MKARTVVATSAAAKAMFTRRDHTGSWKTCAKTAPASHQARWMSTIITARTAIFSTGPSIDAAKTAAIAT